MNLKEKLLSEKRNRWLDVGNGGNFEEGFCYMDILKLDKEKKDKSDKYFQKDVCKLTSKDFEEMGKFDYIRMQHFFEHLTPEEGQIALKAIAKLLEIDGYITISTPDLRVHIDKYEKGDYKNWEGFKWWANKRIPEDAPNSYYFSIFAHSMPWEQHKWCYDSEGLVYQLKSIGKFKNIKELKIDNKLANNPFTHNRPEEDVCVIAQRAN